MRKLQTLLIVLLTATLSHSQDSVDDKSELIINSNLFHNFKIEKYFVHTNKTTYFAGEKVWFKAYVVENGSNLPFKETTNLHLNLYNENLELISSELVRVENGKGYGQFQLSKDIKQGIYYAQLDSYWNKNFNNKTALFKIDVLNLTEQDVFNETTPIQQVKLITKGNKLGINLYRNKALEDKQTYAVEVNIDAEIINSKQLNNTYIFATLHRQGNLKSVVPVLIEEGKTNYKIAFQKKSTFNGINTVSLIDETKEVLAKKSFFWKNTKDIDLQITEHSKTNDTLLLNLKMLNQYKKANISISVLPQNTEMYQNRSNIISSFLLEPYLKINNYPIASLVSEQKINTNKLNYISEIAASETAFPNKDLKLSDLKFKMENGIFLNGVINTKVEDLSNFKIMLSSKKNDILKLTTINDDKTFSFHNLMLMHPSDYDLALVDEKGEMKKASFFVYNNYMNYQPSKTLPKTLLYKHKEDVPSSTVVTGYEDTRPKKLPILHNDIETLDEVTITAIKDREEEKEIKEIARKKGILGLNYSKLFKPQESSYSHLSVLDYIETLPEVSVQYISAERIILYTIINNEAEAVRVRLDGVPFLNMPLLNQRLIEQFEYVIFNRNGVGYGFPVIDLITDRNYAKNNPVENANIQKLKTAFGFNKPETHYEKPELQYTDKQSINSYSTIDWIPNFEIIPGIDNILKINRLNYNDLKLIINGVSQDGKPIYKEYNISLTDD